MVGWHWGGGGAEDTQKLLPSGAAPEEWRKRSNETP